MSQRDPDWLPAPLPAYDFEAERLEADAADLMNASVPVERTGPLSPLPWKLSGTGLIVTDEGGYDRTVGLLRFDTDAEWLVKLANSQHQPQPLSAVEIILRESTAASRRGESEVGEDLLRAARWLMVTRDAAKAAA